MSGISQIKKDIQLNSWAEMVRECHNSGKTVAMWCNEMGINIKTYYYRQSKVREAMTENYSKNKIVPISISPQPAEAVSSESVITIRKNDIELEFSENIAAENLSKILRALQC